VYLRPTACCLLFSRWFENISRVHVGGWGVVEYDRWQASAASKRFENPIRAIVDTLKPEIANPDLKLLRLSIGKYFLLFRSDHRLGSLLLAHSLPCLCSSSRAKEVSAAGLHFAGPPACLLLGERRLGLLSSSQRAEEIAPYACAVLVSR
jgi:hypothetical protein